MSGSFHFQLSKIRREKYRHYYRSDTTIGYCKHKFENIVAMVVVFGSPGLFEVENIHDVLSVKLEICKKPIFHVLPSVLNYDSTGLSPISKEEVQKMVQSLRGYNFIQGARSWMLTKTNLWKLFTGFQR
ncbi:MAG TPA: hypothetical protein VFM72_03835 [Aequorivita sp.]|nr:hypothetical protein [Aequorivita sp.]